VQWAVAIERATGFLVTRQEMFPDTWQDVWPELAKPRKRKPLEKALGAGKKAASV